MAVMTGADREIRWMAVKTRNALFDGTFFFAVRTTGVFCRPSCSSRTPRPENVRFFATADDARSAGFRACLRCRPGEAGPRTEGPGAIVIKALREIRSAGLDAISVDRLARRLGITAAKLQKAFRAAVGMSPKEVIDMMRLEEFKGNVRQGADITTSLYESGFGSSRSLYEKAGERLGMTPATYRKGGKGTTIRYTVARSPIGHMLVAATDRGICAVSFGDTPEDLQRELEAEFFAAEISSDDAGLAQAVDSILRGLNGERSILALPLDIRGTAFQMRVWSELRKIPYGETRSYAEVAAAVGNSKAVRAVARACATNPVAVVTPCHRVVGSDGKLSGYRWGVERKARLLDSEAKTEKE
jgi:AraC family transcriptional regulator, regulatory protein of adaptative response / methylated-DNA-[protein]-cysteine methyltransferase